MQVFRNSLSHIFCFYCFGVPRGIIFGNNGVLSLSIAKFENVNGFWLGLSFGILIALIVLVWIRIRIDWQSEMRRSQIVFDEMEIDIEQFRIRMAAKYGRYSQYGINDELIDSNDFLSPTSKGTDVLSSSTYDWSMRYNEYEERVNAVPETEEQIRFPIDFRLNAFSNKGNQRTIATSFPQSVGPSSNDNSINS